MDFIFNFLQNINNFFISEQLYGWYIVFIFFMFISISIDIYRVKSSNIKVTLYINIIYFLFFIFFLILYLYLSEYINNFVANYMSGEYLNDMKQSESVSKFYTNKIGNSYTFAMIALFSSIYLYFFKLQSLVLKTKVFSTSELHGSIFVNFMLLLIFFTILIFIEQLKYSEFKFSEAVVLHLDVATYFFSLLCITALVVFFSLYIFKKDFILKVDNHS